MDDVLYENKYYKIVLGKVVEEGREIDGYSIVNKKTLVEELALTILPSAINIANDMAEDLGKVMKPSLNVVEH